MFIFFKFIPYNIFKCKKPQEFEFRNSDFKTLKLSTFLT